MTSIQAPNWIPVILLLVLAPVVRRLATATLRRVAQWVSWAPLDETAGALSWLIYPLAIHAALGLSTLPESYSKVGLGITTIVIVLGLVAWSRQMAVSALIWAMRRVQPSQTLKAGFIPLLQNLITLVAGTLGLIAILRHFGFDVMSLITALGVGSLAVGLAAKDTLSHMISGFTIILDRNFVPGDRIHLGSCSGEVEEIGLRSTRLKTPSGPHWVVPNSELVNTKILNQGPVESETLVTTSLRITPASPYSKAHELILQILRETPGVLQHSACSIHLQSLADGFQNIRMGFWVDRAGNSDRVLSHVLERWMIDAPSRGIQMATAPTLPEASS